MRVKEIKIISRPLDEDRDEIIEAFRRTERGEDFKDEKIVVESLDTLRKVLTPERLKILQTIKTHNPKSVYELAKILDRDRSAVIRDLEVLESLGLVEFSEDKKSGRKRRKPVVPYDEIYIRIPVVMG